MNTRDITKEVKSSDGKTLPKCVTMSKARIIKNLIVLCAIYLFLYSPYMALLNLQSTLNSEGNVGVISQSVCYTVFIITSLYLPRLLSIKLGLKNAIIVSILGYVPYISGSFYPTPWTLYPTAAILGIANSTLWISASSYINELSFLYADEDTEKAKPVTTKFFGIFLTVYLTTEIWGNSASFYILQSQSPNSTFETTSLSTFEIVKTTRENISCGAEFCSGPQKKFQLPTQETRNLLIGIYIAFAILAAPIAVFLLDTLTVKCTSVQNTEGTFSKVMTAFKQMIKTDQLFLVVVTIFLGLQSGFIFSDYSEAFVGCAWGIPYIGLVFVCFGVVSASFCVLQSCFAKHLPRQILITFATISNIAVCMTLLHWKPSNGDTAVMFIVVGCWAFSVGVWETQLTAFYGVIFRDETEAAFAAFRLLEYSGYVIAFSCNSVMCMSSKIYMELAFVSVGFIGYLTVELRLRLRSKSCNITNSL